MANQSESVILEEEIDENYEPTEEEVVEYARWLGMDPDEDAQFLYIAKEGLKAPLPEPWKPCKTKEGEIYYFNFENGDSVWEHPCDEYYKKMFEEAKSAKFKRQQVVTKKAPKKDKTPPKKQQEKQSKFNFEEPMLFESEQSKKKHRFQEFLNVESEEESDDPYFELEQEFADKKHKLSLRHEQELEEHKRHYRLEKDDKEYRLQKELQDEKNRKRMQLKKEFADKEQQERDTLNQEFLERINKLKKEHSDLLQKERDSCEKKFQDERVSIQSREEKNNQDEIESMKVNLEYDKKRLERELGDQKDLETRLRDKTQRLKLDKEEELEREKKRLAAELETKKTELQEQEERNRQVEIARKRAELDAKKAELENKVANKQRYLELEYQETIVKIQREFDEKLEKERVKIIENVRRDMDSVEESERQKIKQEIETKRKVYESQKLQELEEYRKQLELSKKDEIERIQKMKNHDVQQKREEMEAEKDQKISELRDKLHNIESFEESDTGKITETINNLQQELAEAKRQLASKKNTLEQAQSKTERYQQNLEQMNQEYRDRANRAPESEIVSDLKRQLESKERLVRQNSVPEDMRIQKMERDLDEIKRLLVSPTKEPVGERNAQAADPAFIEKWRGILTQEKNDIKEAQSRLERDRDMWKDDLRDYQSRPQTAGAKNGLRAVKKILDTQVSRLNDRIKDLRNAEHWLKNKETGYTPFEANTPELDFAEEMMFNKHEPEDYQSDLLQKWRQEREDPSFDVSRLATPADREPSQWQQPPMGYHHAPQPHIDHKLHVYQRHLSKWANNREQIRTAISRHSNWLTSVKDEFSRGLNRHTFQSRYF